MMTQFRKSVVVLVFCFLFLPALSAHAYLSEIKILDKKDIVKLSDDALTAAYIDVQVEIQASDVFHKTSGFTPKEYQQYKDLLRYRYFLKMELFKRKLETPSLEP